MKDMPQILISKIDLGERRRQDYGDIAALAKGIERVGLLNPIIVDTDDGGTFRLVAGGRRLKAFQLLKRRYIPARLFETLSDEDRRDIELEENENRKDLTEAERKRTFAASKKLVDNAKRAADVLSIVDKTPNPKGGRPTKGSASQESVAEALGVSRGTVSNAEQHVATAERFPFMQTAAWRQSHVLAVGEALEKLPEPEQDQAVGVLRCARILEPEDAVRLVTNISMMNADQRADVYRLSVSTDPRDTSLALTKAAQLPPAPDPRLDSLTTALEALTRAAKPFPNDPLTPRIEAVMREVKAIRAAVREVSFDARRDSQPRSAVQ